MDLIASIHFFQKNALISKFLIMFLKINQSINLIHTLQKGLNSLKTFEVMWTKIAKDM